jgi:Putative beta-barrel porin-2, OmpL-like. bbp2
MSIFYFAVAQTNKLEVINPDSTTSGTATAEESKPKTVISGSVDVYYKYDFNKKAGNNKTSFTNSHNSFELGMASVKVEHTIGKVGMMADLGFGQRAKEFSYNDDGITAAIKQLLLTYSPTNWLKLSLGSCATHVGYELVDAYSNRNYSTSYMFSYGPFFHTGLKAEITAGKNGFMLGITNPVDMKTAPPNSKKHIIAQYSITPNDKVKAYVNFMSGQRPLDSAKVNQFDVVATFTVSTKFSIGYNGTINTTKYQLARKYSSGQKWWGSALYLNVDPASWFGLTLRTEYFSDEKQQNVFAAIPGGGSVFETTLSANFRIDNLVIIPEVRFENASKEIYAKSNGTGTKANGNFLIAAVYHF